MIEALLRETGRESVGRTDEMAESVRAKTDLVTKGVAETKAHMIGCEEAAFQVAQQVAMGVSVATKRFRRGETVSWPERERSSQGVDANINSANTELNKQARP